MYALAPEAALSLLEYVSARSAWYDLGFFQLTDAGLDFTESGVQRKAGVGIRKEEMGVWTPKCIIKFCKNLCSSCGGKIVLPRARHSLEGEAEAGERLGLSFARIGMHRAQELCRKEGRETAHRRNQVASSAPAARTRVVE